MTLLRSSRAVSRRLLVTSVALVFGLTACGAESVDDGAQPPSEIDSSAPVQDDPTEQDTEHEAPVEGELLSFDDVCAGLRSAWWDGSAAAAKQFVSDDAVVDTLFQVTYDPSNYNDTSFAGETCILGGIDDVGVIDIAGDGHVGASAYAMTWYDSSWYDDEANWAMYQSGAPGGDAEKDPEVFLQSFATAWGSQDEAALENLATEDVIDIVREAGPGEVTIFFGADCRIEEGWTEGACEAGFMPQGQTECCAQLWNLQYWLTPNNEMFITDLTFGGDLG